MEDERTMIWFSNENELCQLKWIVGVCHIAVVRRSLDLKLCSDNINFSN